MGRFESSYTMSRGNEDVTQYAARYSKGDIIFIGYSWMVIQEIYINYCFLLSRGAQSPN